MPDDREEAGVRVSNAAIYEQLLNLRFEVQDIKAAIKANTEKIVSQEKRIRALEYRFYGIIAGVLGGGIALLKIGGVL